MPFLDVILAVLLIVLVLFLIPAAWRFAGKIGKYADDSYMFPPMSRNAAAILRFMQPGQAIPARSLAQAAEMPVPGVLAAQRELKGLGLAVYGPAVNDNGRVAGSGYSLTPDGREVQLRLGVRPPAQRAA